MLKRHPGLFASILVMVAGCGTSPGPSGSVGPEDLAPLFTDTRLNGRWQVSINDPTSDPVLAFLADSCVTIEALSAVSWQLACMEETLLISFPASAPSPGVAELEMFLLLEGVRWSVRMVVRIQDGSLAIGTVEVSVPGSDLSASASLTLQLLREQSAPPGP